MSSKKQGASPINYVESDTPSTEKIEAFLLDSSIFSKDTPAARSSYDASRFGELKGNKLVYSFVEALYLVEKEKMLVYSGKKLLDFDKLFNKIRKVEPNLLVRYTVFKDLRSRGYIVKTALKFGADFRVYSKGIKPGEDHAKWVVYPVHEGNELTWYEFSAKNRVAHSTRKNLLIGIVDDELDVTYYSIAWTRP
ncbi:MAG TPA: tRNA-intron lyase [Candidatus Nanoarchaeia archaeon]|nr:tRNA-intron lyase [Candidatus Nanoarchaeia archaeon]